MTKDQKHNLLIALMMGLAIPFALIYLMEITNTTVRGRADLDKVAVPFVGEIPSAERKKRNAFQRFRESLKMRYFRKEIEKEPAERKILVKQHSRNVVNEAFRVVRTNIEFMRGNKQGNVVIMVTSMNPGSGKTFITSNLSSSFAIKNKKVLAVDCDLRKKSLSHYVDSPEKGLADWLNGNETDYRPLIVHNVGGLGLDLLPVGTLPPNPAELLSEPAFADLIAKLRQEYDYVFLDCPPVELVTDADIISRQADLTIFVVRAGLLEKDMLPQVDRFYSNGRFPNMALVLNGTEPAGRYGYKYGYKYGYRYGGYGYGKYGSSYGSSYGVYEKK